MDLSQAFPGLPGGMARLAQNGFQIQSRRFNLHSLCCRDRVQSSMSHSPTQRDSASTGSLAKALSVTPEAVLQNLSTPLRCSALARDELAAKTA